MKTIGIYKITNIKNNKVYIGESFDIERRWKIHIDNLNNNNHHSNKLQNDWNTYGKDNFKFEIIRDVTNDMISFFNMELVLLVYEDIYIKEYDSINNGYNMEKTLKKVYEGNKKLNTKQLNSKPLNSIISMINKIIKNINENNGKYYSQELKKSVGYKKTNNNDKNIFLKKQSKEDFKNKFNLIKEFEGFVPVGKALKEFHVNLIKWYSFLNNNNIIDKNKKTIKKYKHIKSIEKLSSDTNKDKHYILYVDYDGLNILYNVIFSDYNNFIYEKYLPIK